LRKGTDILNSVIGKELQDGKIQSFFLNGELIDQINSTYLKFDKWIRIVTTDDMTKVYEIRDIEKQQYSDLEDGMEFPIERIEKHYAEFKKYAGKRLLDWKELVRKESDPKFDQMSVGIKLIFENDLTFIIHNIDYPTDLNEFIFNGQIPEYSTEK